MYPYRLITSVSERIYHLTLPNLQGIYTAGILHGRDVILSNRGISLVGQGYPPQGFMKLSPSQIELSYRGAISYPFDFCLPWNSKEYEPYVWTVDDPTLIGKNVSLAIGLTRTGIDEDGKSTQIASVTASVPELADYFGGILFFDQVFGLNATYYVYKVNEFGQPQESVSFSYLDKFPYSKLDDDIRHQIMSYASCRMSKVSKNIRYDILRRDICTMSSYARYKTLMNILRKNLIDFDDRSIAKQAILCLSKTELLDTELLFIIHDDNLLRVHRDRVDQMTNYDVDEVVHRALLNPAYLNLLLQTHPFVQQSLIDMLTHPLLTMEKIESLTGRDPIHEIDNRIIDSLLVLLSHGMQITEDQLLGILRYLDNPVRLLNTLANQEEVAPNIDRKHLYRRIYADAGEYVRSVLLWLLQYHPEYQTEDSIRDVANKSLNSEWSEDDMKNVLPVLLPRVYNSPVLSATELKSYLNRALDRFSEDNKLWSMFIHVILNNPHTIIDNELMLRLNHMYNQPWNGSYTNKPSKYGDIFHLSQNIYLQRIVRQIQRKIGMK